MKFTSAGLRLLPCLACLGLSSGSSLAGAAAHGGPSCRPAVLTHGLRLRGGQEAPRQPLVLRLNSRDGIKRITTPGGHATLSMLQQIIRTQLHIPPSKQLVSLQPGGEPLEMSGEQTLAELRLTQGSMLHLASKVGIDTASADKAARRASSTLRRVSMDVTADKTLLKVAVASAPAASCQFVSIDARAWQNFAAYLVDTEMELVRVALLFGRVTEGDGVQVRPRHLATPHHRTTAPPHHRTTAQFPPPHRPATAIAEQVDGLYELHIHCMHTTAHAHHCMHMHTTACTCTSCTLQVDVFYEMPQEATADGFALLQTPEAAAQRARATQVAARLGLQLVGWTFAHPPRAHEVTVSELEQMAPMQKLLNSSQARPSIGAAHGGRWATGQRVRQKVGQRVGQREGWREGQRGEQSSPHGLSERRCRAPPCPRCRCAAQSPAICLPMHTRCRCTLMHAARRKAIRDDARARRV